MEGDCNSVNFLDTTVFRDCNHKLCVKPFIKPTDCNTYLHYKSFHTRQLRNNIPYGQYLRLKRNATHHVDFKVHAQRLRAQFLQRGYPPDVLDAEVKAIKRDRESLFKPSRPDPCKRLNWALEYSPLALSISRIIKKHWSLVSYISGCELPPRIGYRRTRSLRSILVNADTSFSTGTLSSDPVGHYKCGICKICSLTVTTKVLHFSDKGFSHTLKSFSNCKTCFTVYLLTCKCGKRYIGSTVRQLRVRILEHISRIKNQVAEAPLVHHFTTEQHGSSDFTICVLETVQPSLNHDTKRVLLQKESYWIHRLNTLDPYGLNNELELSMFL